MVTGCENSHWRLDVTLDAKMVTGRWTRILQNFTIFAELPLMASKSSQNKFKIFPINSKYINNTKTLHKQELLINIHQINNNPNFKTQNLNYTNFHFFNLVHFPTTLKSIHNNPKCWLFDEERKNEWALGPSEELSFNPTTTPLYQHQLNPKANQKKNKNPLKPSFSMKVHGWSRENKNELKDRKNGRLPHLGPVNNHYREEKGTLFLHSTKVQGSLIVVLEEERIMKRSVLREREKERVLAQKRVYDPCNSSFSHLNLTTHTHLSNHKLKSII